MWAFLERFGRNKLDLKRSNLGDYVQFKNKLKTKLARTLLVVSLFVLGFQACSDNCSGTAGCDDRTGVLEGGNTSAYTVSGTLLNDKGHPVDSAVLNSYKISNSDTALTPSYQVDYDTLIEALTNSEGKYQMIFPDSGKWILFATKNDTLGKVDTLTLTASDSNLQKLDTLFHLITINGSLVTSDSLESDSAEIENKTVAYIFLNGNKTDTLTTDSLGRFTLSAFTGVNYLLIEPVDEFEWSAFQYGPFDVKASGSDTLQLEPILLPIESEEDTTEVN